MGPTQIDLTGPKLEWPHQLMPMIAISMRAHRYQDLERRMRHWASLITLLPATQGTKLNYAKWDQMGRCPLRRLSHGQMGCYESHVRVWKLIVQERLPRALVLEDDADIVYSEKTVQRLNEFLHELERIPDWDVAYLGNVPLHPPKRTLAPHINEPSYWEGLYCYMITYEGARKLLPTMFPMRQAIDVHVGNQMRKGLIRGVMMNPALCYVVPVVSDTDVRRTM